MGFFLKFCWEMCQKWTKIGGNLAIEICAAGKISIKITEYLPLALKTTGHCCNNKITPAYRANPLTRHKSGHYFLDGVKISSSGQGSEPSGQEIQSCYGAGARDFWLIVFTNSIWLDSPSLSLSAGLMMVSWWLGLVSSWWAHHQARAHTMQTLTLQHSHNINR